MSSNGLPPSDQHSLTNPSVVILDTPRKDKEYGEPYSGEYGSDEGEETPSLSRTETLLRLVLFLLILCLATYAAVISGFYFTLKSSNISAAQLPECNSEQEAFPCQVSSSGSMYGGGAVPSTSPPPGESQNSTTSSTGGLPAFADFSAAKKCTEQLSFADFDYMPQDNGGRILSGSVNVYLVWYGDWTDAQKQIVRGFIQSTNEDVDPLHFGLPSDTPTVFQWWSQVSGDTPVNRTSLILENEYDAGFSIGEALFPELDIPPLLNNLTNPSPTLTKTAPLPMDPNGVYVVALGARVVFPGLCAAEWAPRQQDWAGVGMTQGGDNLTYAYVSMPDQGKDCDVTKARSKVSWINGTSPSGDRSMDAVIDRLAGSLVSAVTNSDGQGLSVPSCHPSPSLSSCDSYTLCPFRYGTILPHPSSAKSFNAIGQEGNPFLLPKIWGSTAGIPGCSLSALTPSPEFGNPLNVDFGRVSSFVLPRILTTTFFNFSNSLSPPQLPSLPLPQSLLPLSPFVPGRSSSGQAAVLVYAGSLQEMQSSGMLNALSNTGKNYTVFVPYSETISSQETGADSKWMMVHVVYQRYTHRELMALAGQGETLESLFQHTPISLSFNATQRPARKTQEAPQDPFGAGSDGSGPLTAGPLTGGDPLSPQDQAAGAQAAANSTANSVNSGGNIGSGLGPGTPQALPYGALNVGWGSTSVVSLSFPDLLCTDTICFHGLRGMLE